MTDTQLLQAIYGDLQNVKADLANMHSDINAIKTDVASLKKQTYQNSETLNLLKRILDQEISHNILLLAEGHLNILQRLNTMNTGYHTDQKIAQILQSSLKKDLYKDI